MKRQPVLVILLVVALLVGGDPSARSPTPIQAEAWVILPAASRGCTSFCVDNGGYCVFGANQDNTIDAGLLFVNKRHVLKTAWDPSTSGEYARWISKYGSVTVVHAGYQLAWAGMNEAGLMISTMALGATRNPVPDERPPLASSFWAQYQLDNHSTVEEVLASEAQVRIAGTVDHYLVCDRKGDCATIEFLEGEMVYHTGESLPVKALANSIYQESLSEWEEGIPWGAATVRAVGPDSPAARAGVEVGDVIVAVDGVQLEAVESLEGLLSTVEAGDEIAFTIRRPGDRDLITVIVKTGSRVTEEGEEGPSLGAALSIETSRARFATAADRLEEFEPASAEEAVAYAFDTLAAVASRTTAWSIVFDPANLRIYFHTNRNPQVRYADLRELDFSCRTPVMMLDVHADVSGDFSDDLVLYSHDVSFNHTVSFVEQYEGLDLPPLLVDALLRGLESFSCVEGDTSLESKAGVLLEDFAPLLPPTLTWAARAIFFRFWPAWVVLTLLSLAVTLWHAARSRPIPWSRRLAWGLAVVLLGPLGLLVYLLASRRRRRTPSEAQGSS